MIITPYTTQPSGPSNAPVERMCTMTIQTYTTTLDYDWHTHVTLPAFCDVPLLYVNCVVNR